MDTIDQHIQKNVAILNDPTTSPQSRRHTEEELVVLEIYRANHPEDLHDPTTLELYCELNPNARECRIYED
jgi:archaellum component FlaG (FlaF/FlaG flagellin family)